MRRPLHAIVICGLQVAALVLFSAIGPLAHLHQGRVAYTDRHGERVTHRRSILHAHLQGHPHGHRDGHHHPGEDGEEAASISYGKLDSPRHAAFPEPSATLVLGVEAPRAVEEIGWVLSDPSQDAHGPPGSILKPVRAPPSFS